MSCVARCECDEDYVDDGAGNCILEIECPETTEAPVEETTIAINSPNPSEDDEDNDSSYEDDSNYEDTNNDSNSDNDSDEDSSTDSQENNNDNDSNDSNTNNESNNNSENDSDNNDSGNGATGGFGDPHFHVLGRSKDQPDLCFDYDGDGTDVMTILDDKDNNIVISSTLFKEASTQKTYFKSITMVGFKRRYQNVI